MTYGDHCDRGDEPPQMEIIEMNVSVSGRLEVKQKLAEIVAEVLEVEDVNEVDNFFDLGGNSISMMLVIARIKSTFNLDVDADFFYDVDPTISALAEKLEEPLASQRAAH